MTTLQEKIDAVVSIHYEIHGFCSECGEQDIYYGEYRPVRWPCPTVDILTGA